MSAPVQPGGSTVPQAQSRSIRIPDNQKPCNLWLQGNCRFGTRCKYRHDEEAKGMLRRNQAGDGKVGERNGGRPQTQSPVVVNSVQPRRSENANTALSSVKSVAAAQSSTPASSPKEGSPNAPGKQTNANINVYTVSNLPVKAAICRDWKAGKCPRGEKCRFRHDNQPSQIETELQGVGSTINSVNEQARTRGLDKGKKPKFNARQQELASQRHMEEERLAKEKADREAAEETRRKEEKRCREEEEKRVREEGEKRLREEEEEKRLREEEEKRLREQEEKRLREQEEKRRREQEQRRRAEEEKRRREQEQRRKEQEEKRREAIRRKEARRLEQERRRNEQLAREKAEKEAQEAARKRHQEQLEARREKEAAAIEQYVVSESSLVTCDAGLNIRHVVTGFELCRITIKDLPRDAKREEIADIFIQQGVDSSEFFILEVKPSGNKLESVILANADQGEAIAVGLEGIEFRDEALRFEVSDNASWNAMGAGTRNAPFLTISFWVPSETIIATYHTMEETQRQARKLNSMVWKGRRIRAMMNERPNGVAGLRNFVPESVKLMGCAPGTASDYEFYEFAGTYNVRVLKSVAYDLEDMFRTVRRHLANCAGVQMETYEVLANGDQLDGEVKIKVQFNDWDDAKRAHDTLDKKRLGFNSSPILRSWLPKPLQYSIKIPRQQYEAQKKQWDGLSEKKPGSDAHVHTRVGDRGDVFIRVLGQDKKAAGPLKVRVECMVAGDKLDPTTHWHPSFASPIGKALFDRILREKKVYIRNDFKTRSLKAYGEAERIAEAQQMIRQEVDRLAQMETTRILDQGCVRGFMREGLGKLKELLGEDNVTLNVAVMPYRVTIKGGEEATHHLQRLIEESRATGFLGEVLPGGPDKEKCPICFDDVSNPEQLGCGHTYCSGCLKDFLRSAADTKKFPLVCMGNEGACNVPIATPFIRRFLPAQAFQSLVESAFTTYLEQHPQELKYCTTPDCTQIYRRRKDKTTLQCPSCFSTICPSCDEEAHEGMSCEERRIHKNPAEQERLNEELARANGYKKCPQCKVLIEKTMGCNHMSCRCGAHICWRCMGIFGYPEIYDHMNTAHGNIYDEVPAGVNPGNAADDVFLRAQIEEIARIERMRQVAEAARLRPAVPVRNDHIFGRVGQVNQYGGIAAARQPPAAPVVDEAARRLEILRRQREEERRRNAQEQADNERIRRAELVRRWDETVRAETVRNRQLENQRAAEARRRQEEDKGWCVVM